MNKYFKMFDNIEELETDLISIIKDNNIEISNILENEIILQLKVLARNDNLVKINLQKVEINEKDKISILFEKYEELKESNNIKDNKILGLENKIKSLENDLNEFKNIFTKFKEEVNHNFKQIENNNNNNDIFSKILKNSNIFEKKEEIELLLNNIQNSNNLKMIYNSEIDGENEEKLLDAYTMKNDLIILVKTRKSKRFGGYAHECFEKERFNKEDIKAFLFNLDKKKIYVSNNKLYTIWRGGNTYDSINFGTGTDLKIFHKFLGKECKTYQHSCNYNYNDEDYALNGEESFSISFLEIYKVLFKGV